MERQTSKALRITSLVLTSKSIVFSSHSSIDNGNAFSKFIRGFDAFEKNTGTVHSLAECARKAFDKRATGSEALTDAQEELWFGTISVGSPAQDFTGE
jgi:hypothetical protein